MTALGLVAVEGSQHFTNLSRDARIDETGRGLDLAATRSDTRVPHKPDWAVVWGRAAGGRNGIEVLQRIRGEASLRHLVVILWTASAAPSAISKAYQCGVNSFLIKPGDARDLIELAKLIKAYWLDRNKMPPECEGE